MLKSRIVVSVILAILLLSGIYFWKNRTSPAQKYINEKWKFSLEIPYGFLVDETDNFLYVVKEPTPDDETPFPEMRVKIEQGNKTTIDPSNDLEVISQTKVSINKVSGHKTVIIYGDLPEGTMCPVYRLHYNDIVYEFSLYECLESSIFESVVISFRIIR